MTASTAGCYLLFCTGFKRSTNRGKWREFTDQPLQKSTRRAYNTNVHIRDLIPDYREVYVYSHPKSLLVRADFVLGNRSGGNRLSCKRWRRLLADVLPRLMGCVRRCPRAVVRLHEGEGEAKYTGWLRIPIERRPSRKRLRRLKANWRARLEAGLLLIDGRVLKLGVRRHAAHPAEPITWPCRTSMGRPGSSRAVRSTIHAGGGANGRKLPTARGRNGGRLGAR